MSHTALLQDNRDFNHPDHLALVKMRQQHLTTLHRKRIFNVNLERKLITGDIWLNDPAPDERRITSPMAHNIVNLGAQMLLPKPPTIRIYPSAQTYQAETEADVVQRWTYAALDSVKAWPMFSSWAKESMFGVGALHLTPDPFAMHDEVPVILDVPDSASILYQLGPRQTIDYCFIKHRYTARDLRRIYNTSPASNPSNENATVEVWTYYAEERYIDEAGNVNKMVLYGVVQGNSFLWPLTDVTSILPNIPVFLAFNQDGYHWHGMEEMRALGILTQHQQLLLYASDYLSQLANGMIRFINPPLTVESDPNTEPPQLDMRPGAINDLRQGEKIQALYDIQPNAQGLNFFNTIKQTIAEGTLPQMLIQAQDLSGVSGSAFADALTPATLKNTGRQQGMSYAMQDFCTLFLKHMAAVIDPMKGFQAFGVDPRDQRQLREIAHPGMLLKNCRVQVEMSEQTPRNVFQFVTLMLQLADKHILPERLVSETVAQLLSLKVTDYESMEQAIVADRVNEAQLQMMQQKAMEALPFVKQQHNQEQQNPNVTSDGQRPFFGGAQHQDSTIVGQSQLPTRQLPQVQPSQPLLPGVR